MFWKQISSNIGPMLFSKKLPSLYVQNWTTIFRKPFLSHNLERKVSLLRAKADSELWRRECKRSVSALDALSTEFHRCGSCKDYKRISHTETYLFWQRKIWNTLWLVELMKFSILRVTLILWTDAIARPLRWTSFQYHIAPYFLKWAIFMFYIKHCGPIFKKKCPIIL